MDMHTEDLDLIPTIELSAHHEIHLAESISLEDAKKELTDRMEEDDDDDANNNANHFIRRLHVTDVEPVQSSEATTHWAHYSLKRKRAALVSATVQKENRNDKIGLCLKKDQGFLTISSIHPGLFSRSPFQVGDRIVSINNIGCQDVNMRAAVAAQLLRNTTGTLTVVVQNPTGDAQLVESMVSKPSKDSKTGLSVISTGFSRASVFHINPNGMFAQSLLNRQDLILSINNIPCQNLDSSEAAAIVGQAEESVTVVAERRFESAVVVAMAQ